MKKRPVKSRASPQRAMVAAASQEDPQSAEQRAARLDLLAKSLVRFRNEAIEGRKASGIEDVWHEDEEYYEGYDDKNRYVTAGAASKPPGQIAPRQDASECIEFPNITGPYVDAAASKISDILQPTDGRAWSLKETPIPELIEKATKGGLPIEAIQGMAELGVDEATAVKTAQAEQQAAASMLAEAKDKAERAQKRIEDWQVDSNYHGVVRKVIDAAAKVGTGVMKGPIPVVSKRQAFTNGKLVIEAVTKPISKDVDHWNCYPDPACGESIHNGRFHWECEYVTAKQLEMLKLDSDYLADQIDAVLTDGPAKRSTESTRQMADGRILNQKDLFQIWYFYGYAQREDLEAAGCECKDNAPVNLPVCFTMVNDRVVKGALNHLDTGEFPYDYFRWKRRKNSPWGNGVGRAIRPAQRIVVAATRVMLTNGGRSAGPMVVMKNKVVGANGNNNIEPWKVFIAPEDFDVREAFAMIEIPDRQQAMQAIINFGFMLAEKITGLPMMLQGQQGDAPDTLGGQQLFDRNASGVLRRIARNMDDDLTEPHINRYYTYLLMYGPEDAEKGEFVLDARGSTALVERELYKQETQALLQASLNPAYGINPKRTMTEYLRASNRNPKDFEYTDEELQQQQQQQAPPDPKVQVAQINAQSKKDVAQLDAQNEQAIEDKRLQAEAQEREKDRQLALVEQEVLQQIESMKLQGARALSFDEIRAMLASTTMKLRVQQALSTMDTAVDMHKHDTKAPVLTPPTEPIGRAENGKAYQQ